MRIAVLGAGAVGSLFGAFLANEHEVTLVCRRAHAKAISGNGLKIIGLSEMHVHPKVVESALDLDMPDILFLTVKAYDTEEAMQDLKGQLDENTVLVSLQNGLGNIEAIRNAIPEANLIAGITSQGAVLKSPGVVQHTGKSYTMLGGPDSELVATVLSNAGIPAETSDDIDSEIWYKAIVNSVINPLGTLFKSTNGLIKERPELEQLVHEIVAEGVDVANAKGMGLNMETAIARLERVVAETSANTCSMRLDVEKGKRTEIMQINGAIARYGSEVLLQTPANSLLAALISGLGSSRQ